MLFKKKVGLQARWFPSLGLFFLPLIIFLVFRWLFFEPFMIPSESMLPNLFINDHIIVSKSSYGVKALWGDGWLFKWSSPQRGDVVVFRNPENREVFFIKRIVGLPKDIIEFQNEKLFINGQMLTHEKLEFPFETISPRLVNLAEASYFFEIIDSKKIFVRYENSDTSTSYKEKDSVKYVVKEGEYFVSGDNRNQSYDSRFIGAIPEKLLIGQAKFIWFSCESMLESMPFLCDPKTLRLERLFKGIN